MIKQVHQSGGSGGKNVRSGRILMSQFFCVAVALSLPIVVYGAQTDSEYSQGVAEYNKGLFSAATTHFKSSIAGVGKNNPSAHYYLGLSLMRMHDTNQAAQEFNTCISLHPGATFVEYCQKALTACGRPTGAAVSHDTTAGPAAESADGGTAGAKSADKVELTAADFNFDPNQLPRIPNLNSPALPDIEFQGGTLPLSTRRAVVPDYVRRATAQYEQARAFESNTRRLLVGRIRSSRQAGESQEHYEAMRKLANEKVEKAMEPCEKYVSNAKAVIDAYQALMPTMP